MINPEVNYKLQIPTVIMYCLFVTYSPDCIADIIGHQDRAIMQNSDADRSSVHFGFGCISNKSR